MNLHHVARMPEVQRRLEEEVAALGGRAPTFKDVQVQHPPTTPFFHYPATCHLLPCYSSTPPPFTSRPSHPAAVHLSPLPPRHCVNPPPRVGGSAAVQSARGEGVAAQVRAHQPVSAPGGERRRAAHRSRGDRGGPGAAVKLGHGAEPPRVGAPR